MISSIVKEAAISCHHKFRVPISILSKIRMLCRVTSQSKHT